jgi:hypothetical protein
MTTHIIVFLGLMILFGIGFFIGSLVGIGKGSSTRIKKKKPALSIYCFQCEIEMPVKEKKAGLAVKIADCTMEQNYSITEICTHNISEIRVIKSVATCETTVLVCTECGEHIETPKTEC